MSIDKQIKQALSNLAPCSNCHYEVPIIDVTSSFKPSFLTLLIKCDNCGNVLFCEDITCVTEKQDINKLMLCYEKQVLDDLTEQERAILKHILEAEF